MNTLQAKDSSSADKSFYFIDSASSSLELVIQNLSCQNFFFIRVHLDGMGNSHLLEIKTFHFHFLIDILKLSSIYSFNQTNNFANEGVKSLEIFIKYLDKIIRSTKVTKLCPNKRKLDDILKILFPNNFFYCCNIVEIDILAAKMKGLENLEAQELQIIEKFLSIKPTVIESIDDFNKEPNKSFVRNALSVFNIYSNINKSKLDKICLDLKTDLLFKGEILLINEKNFHYMDEVMNHVQKISYLALDYVYCPRDKVIDLFVIATVEKIFVVDIKNIKKLVFNESKKKLKDPLLERRKENFVMQLNEILNSSKFIKISFNFHMGLETLRNRFKNDIKSIHHLLDLKKYCWLYEMVKYDGYNDMIFGMYQKVLCVNLEGFDLKSKILSPMVVHKLCTRTYSMIKVFENRILNKPFTTENIILDQNVNDLIDSSMFLSLYENNYQENFQLDCASLKDWNFDEKKIFIIDSLNENFYTAIEKINKEIEVGMDSEWHPKGCDTSILQIATASEIYIFDLFTYNKSLKKVLTLKEREFLKNEFYNKIADFFNNDRILKVCFDFECDRCNIERIIDPSLLNKEWRLLDLKSYRQYILGGEKGGLKDLVERVFKKELCKRMQLSDWNQRPLLNEQINYAALDAFVVLQIYLKLKKSLDAIIN